MTHAEQPVRPLRLFFALWPDGPTRSALAEWSRAIHCLSGGRATRPEMVHLTLAFLGDTDPATLPAIEAAGACAWTRPFVLALDEAGFWSHNKIAWAGARTSPPELQTLVSGLRSALQAAGVRFDPKPFVPHLTLIRKGRPGFALPQLRPISWPVRDVVLVRSTLTRTGSEYSIHARWD